MKITESFDYRVIFVEDSYPYEMPYQLQVSKRFLGIRYWLTVDHGNSPACVPRMLKEYSEKRGNRYHYPKYGRHTVEYDI